MERDFYTDEFEQLIKEKADQFRMYPSKRVWHSIYNNLHPSRRWPSFVISILFLTSLVSIGYLNTSDSDSYSGRTTVKAVADIPSEIKTENPGLSNPASSITSQDNNPAIASVAPATISVSSTVKNTNPANTGSVPVTSPNKGNTKPVSIASATNRITGQPASSRKNAKGSGTAVPTTDPADLALTKANKPASKFSAKQAGITETAEEESENNDQLIQEVPKNLISVTSSSPLEKASTPDTKPANEQKASLLKVVNSETKADVNSEKAWIENFALYNKPTGKPWKDRLDFEFYVTPAVNYRKLTTDSKGSTTAFATVGDINKSISQKPGIGLESGAGISYAFAKNLRLKAGVQFNYTNYNINADQINHPIQTSILLTDPATGYSYPAARISTVANAYDNKAVQPITLHNRTYQVSIPVGLAYKLSSNKNVEWFVGATAQPSYIFGGKAHLISSDLQNYVSDPSSIRHWNLNIGIETFMTYKLGAYSFRVGPQVRYQVYSTYRKDIALIEKPYAVGLKFGIVKGF